MNKPKELVDYSQILSLVENSRSMVDSIKYLKNFTKQLEEADRLYAERLMEQMKEEEEFRIKELAEIAKRDREFVERLQKEQEQAEQTRRTQQKKLTVRKKSHMRNISGASATRPSVSGKRKKVAIDVKLGERIKCHDGIKGIVKFLGFVHFTNVPMVGIIVTDGQGDGDGSWDNHKYFETKPGKGKFCSHPEISHVYRNRASDGKEEKLRYSPPKNNEANSPGSMLGSPVFSIRESQAEDVRPSFTKKQLLTMNTEAQIELAMQLSADTGANFTNDNAYNPSSVPIQEEEFGHSDKNKKKEMYKEREQKRLFREGSVHILNGLLDSIDDEQQKKQVFDQFVRNRSVALAE